jgi:hypothetical protein
MGKTLPIQLVLAAVISTEAHAGCNATVNGRRMSAGECEAACQIYGSYPYGDYLRDSQGNWMNTGNPSERGNIYLDARYSRGCNSSGGSAPSNESGCFNSEWFDGGCIW